MQQDKIGKYINLAETSGDLFMCNCSCIHTMIFTSFAYYASIIIDRETEKKDKSVIFFLLVMNYILV